MLRFSATARSAVLFSALSASCATSHLGDESATQRVVSLDVQRFGSVVALDDGSVYRWGDEPYAILPPSPIELSALRGATSVVTGPVDVCGILEGRVVCVQSRRGSESQVIEGIDAATSLQSSSLGVFARDRADHYSMIVSYSCRGDRALAWCEPVVQMRLSSSSAIGPAAGNVLVQGGYVVLARPADLWRASALPGPDRLFPELATAVAITHVQESGCVVLADASALCWPGCRLGDMFGNDHSLACWHSDQPAGQGWQVTDPETVFRDPGLRDVVEVAHTQDDVRDPSPLYCARQTDGAVWCWGSNGCGLTEPRDWRTDVIPPSPCHDEWSDVPRRIPLPGPATSIGSGDRHACALVDGAVYCWGGNYHGQLGDGTRVDSAEPVRVALPARE